jgi:hypothetical protein
VILYLYQTAEKSYSEGAIAVIAPDEKNAQQLIRHYIQNQPKVVGCRDNDFRFYVHEPRANQAKQYHFPFVLKERFVVAGCLAQRVVLFVFSRG